jgi:hypothetical protein
MNIVITTVEIVVVIVLTNTNSIQSDANLAVL